MRYLNAESNLGSIGRQRETATAQFANDLEAIGDAIASDLPAICGRVESNLGATGEAALRRCDCSHRDCKCELRHRTFNACFRVSQCAPAQKLFCSVLLLLRRARCALPERIRPPKMRFGCATRRAIASDFSSGQRRRRPLLPLKDLHPVAAVAAFLNREISLSACDAHFESASHPF